MGGNDWTRLDPAIVGGQLSNARSESPSNWIKSNLEQLTSESPSQQLHQQHPKALQNSLMPGFSNMSLSGGAAGVGQQNRGPTASSSQWGQLSNMGGSSGGTGSSTAPPPPGFAFGRGQIPHSFPNLSSLNTSSDGHQIESKILPFTLS